MRVLGLVLLFLFFSGQSTLAQTIEEQLKASLNTFLGGQSTERYEFSAQFRMNLLTDLNGSWIPAVILPVEDFGAICERNPIKIDVKNGYAFSLEYGLGNERQRVDQYYFRSGARFVHVSPPEEIAKFFGVDENKASEMRMFEHTLRGFNREVSVFRPSHDMLVIIADGGIPEMYARCMD